MADSSGDNHFSSRSPRGRHSPTSDVQNIIPHLLAPLLYDHPYLSAGENPRNIGVQFLHSCAAQDSTQLNSDILHRPPHLGDDGPPMAIAYPESSQRTTSHALSPYGSDASRFAGFSPCDLATLHIVDAPLHGPQPSRRSSWPSHPQAGYSPWAHSPPRMLRSPASEPPESTSDESYQDSDPEEAPHMSPMLNQFQIHSSRNVDPATHHANRAQSLQPSVMTFQLSETMLRLVDDPENRHMMHSMPDTRIMADDQSDVAHPSPSSTLPASSPNSFGGTMLQGPGMRFQHDSDMAQLHMPASSFDSTPFSPPHSPADSRAGDHRLTGTKQQKKSKMHHCQECGKSFPRPSGLATHMNTHSGARPYRCIVPGCQKSFAVRSNAKRHLRTHGINPASPGILSEPRYTVGFDKPMVTHVQDAGKQPLRYRWIPHVHSPYEGEWPAQGSSSSTIAGGSETSLTFQTSVSSTTSTILSAGSDDDYDEVVTSSVVDVHQYQSDYSRGANEYPRDYPDYGEHS